MNLLKGKCKEDFENWFVNNMYQDIIPHQSLQSQLSMIEGFYTEPLNKQYGVLVDFFDSVSALISGE